LRKAPENDPVASKSESGERDGKRVQLWHQKEEATKVRKSGALSDNWEVI